jgi:VWFA-related protein
MNDSRGARLVGASSREQRVDPAAPRRGAATCDCKDVMVPQPTCEGFSPIRGSYIAMLELRPDRLAQSGHLVRRAALPRTAARLLLMAIALAPGALPAQAPPPDDGEIAFGDTLEVAVAEVEVFVTDAQGRPVSGLTRNDFRLVVGGEPREITGWYEARPEAAAGGGELTVETGGPEDTVAPAPAAEPPPRRRQSIAVILDQLHLRPAARRRTLERIAPMLEARLAAGDDVLLATLDRSLTVRRPFGASTKLAADIAAVFKTAPGGIGAEVQRRQTLDDIRNFHASAGCSAMAEMTMMARSWAQRVEHDTRTTFNGMQGFLAELGGRQGHTSVLFVTEGLTLAAGLEAFLLIDQLCGGNTASLLTRPLDALAANARAANAARVTLYMLDAGGLRAPGSVEDTAPSAVGDQWQVAGDAADSLTALAWETGGRALLESNRPEVLVEQLAGDLAAYYSLAFVPRPADAERSQRVTVEVLRTGLRVRHRASWEALAPEARLEAQLRAALTLGGGETNPLDATLTSSAPRRAADGSWTVPLRLEVPADRLALIPDGERRRGRLRVLVAVADADGRSSPARALTLPVDLPAEGEGALVPLEMSLRVAAGESIIGLAVRDEVGAEVSLLRHKVRAGPTR